MSAQVVEAIKAMFPGEEHVGVRRRCALALGMGYSVVVVAAWITLGKTHEQRQAWQAALLPKLEALAVTLDTIKE